MPNATQPVERKPQVQFSADFLAWYELAKAYPAVMHADSEWERKHSHRTITDQEFEARPYARHLETMRELEERIYVQQVHVFEDLSRLRRFSACPQLARNG